MNADELRQIASSVKVKSPRDAWMTDKLPVIRAVMLNVANSGKFKHTCYIPRCITIEDLKTLFEGCTFKELWAPSAGIHTPPQEGRSVNIMWA